MADAMYGSYDGSDALVDESIRRTRGAALKRAQSELPAQMQAIGVPEQIAAESANLEGHGPGYGPGRVEQFLLQQHGTLDELPAWNNADQFARAGAKRALGTGATGSSLMDEYRKTQFLLPPERAKYMQTVGRAVDVLSNLRQDPERAMYFWDRSAKPDSDMSRTDYNDPVYQRFGEDNVSPFFAGISPVNVALRKMNYIPSAMAFRAAESPTWSEAARRASAASTAAERVRPVGENPVLDLPEDATPEQNVARMQDLAALSQYVHEPPDQNVANSVLKFIHDNSPQWHVAFGGQPMPEAPKASKLLAQLIGIARESADPSMLLAGAGGAARFARGATKALRTGKAMNPASMPRLLGLYDDMRNEVLFDAAIQQAVAPGLPESMYDYAFSPQDSVPLDSEGRQFAADEVLRLQEANPQSIWESRERAFRDVVVPGAQGSLGARYKEGPVASVLRWLRSESPDASAWAGR